ncbi:hypothetical protein L9F63_010442, partial [Diploptera punctata]
DSVRGATRTCVDAKLDSHKMEQNEEADIKEEPKSEVTTLKDVFVRLMNVKPDISATNSQLTASIEELSTLDLCSKELKTNGVDNEDSINLTIGEDEEKLLAEEEDSSSQDKESKANVEGATAPDGSGDAGQETAAQDTTEEKQESADKGNVQEDKENDGEKKDKESSDDKTTKTSWSITDSKLCTTSPSDTKTSKDDKDKKKSKSGSSGSSSSSSSRNLWVSGLSSSTRATDLKQVFSKYGKVIGAKVVTNARTPGARCYGYVTMATSEDASKCIQHLHRTELHGRMISVERTKGDASGPPRKSESSKLSSSSSAKRHERKPSSSNSKDPSSTDKKKEEDKKEDGEAEKDLFQDLIIIIIKTWNRSNKGGESSEAKDNAGEGGEKAEGEENDKADATKTPGSEQKSKEDRKRSSRELSRDRRHRSAESSHYSHRSRSPRRSRHHGSPSRRPGVLTFAQIRDERERQRQRERERELREEDRRRRDEVMRQREIEKRHREEAMRLEREKEKLRIERERIERERSELMRLERERQRQERERLEREREELKRQQMRFEETRRTVKRPSTDRRDAYPEERKRVATERRFDGTARFEEGPPRFERGPNFRVREERRPEGEHRGKMDVRHSRDNRYPESGKGDSRYTDRAGDTWHAGGGPPPVKPFSSMGSGGVPPRDSWGPSSDRKADGQNWGRPMDSGASDRWVSGGSGPMGVVGRGGPSMGPGSMYNSPQNVAPNMSGMNMGMSGGSGPYSGDRFDAYKQSMGPIRKY